MTRGFILTPEANQDLLDIWEHLATEESDATADRVVTGIMDACEKLVEMPAMGHYREELIDRRFRFWRAWSYLIVYRWESSPFEVIATVHGARDLEAFLTDRGQSA